MTSTAIKSASATIAVGDGTSPEDFTTIKNVTNIGGPNKEAPEIDVTDLSSTDREYLQGLADPGLVECSGFYDPTDSTHQQLRDRVGSGTADNYKITYSDSSTEVFSARVQTFERGNAVDEAVPMSFSLKITGTITFSP